MGRPPVSTPNPSSGFPCQSRCPALGHNARPTVHPPGPGVSTRRASSNRGCDCFPDWVKDPMPALLLAHSHIIITPTLVHSLTLSTHTHTQATVVLSSQAIINRPRAHPTSSVLTIASLCPCCIILLTLRPDLLSLASPRQLLHFPPSSPALSLSQSHASSIIICGLKT